MPGTCRTGIADSSAIPHELLELSIRLDLPTPGLRAAARPHLERAREATGETTNLVVLDGERVTYVDQVEGSNSMRLFTALGSIALALATGSGKAILAFQPRVTLDRLYPRDQEPFEGLTGHTMRMRQDLAARLRPYPSPGICARRRRAQRGGELCRNTDLRCERERRRCDQRLWSDVAHRAHRLRCAWRAAQGARGSRLAALGYVGDGAAA